MLVSLQNRRVTLRFIVDSLRKRRRSAVQPALQVPRRRRLLPLQVNLGRRRRFRLASHPSNPCAPFQPLRTYETVCCFVVVCTADTTEGSGQGSGQGTAATDYTSDYTYRAKGGFGQYARARYVYGILFLCPTPYLIRRQRLLTRKLWTNP